MNFKRVHRLWKQEHLQVPVKQRKRRRLSVSVGRVEYAVRGEVVIFRWSHSVAARTHRRPHVMEAMRLGKINRKPSGDRGKHAKPYFDGVVIS